MTCCVTLTGTRYHVCIHIDLNNSIITAAVNGQTFRKEGGKQFFQKSMHIYIYTGLGNSSAVLKNKKPETLAGRLILGTFNSTWGNLRTGRFQGRVTNIQVFCIFGFHLSSTDQHLIHTKILRDSSHTVIVST